MKNASTQKILALLALLVSAAFSQVAFALPVFARQTGLTCDTCHFQQFPMLDAFGRSFKNAGFTLIGTEKKVEGGGLSIPESLNLGILTTLGFENVSNPNQAANPDVYNSVNTPAGGGELSVFYGGRINKNMGFLAELGVAGSSAATSSAKLPIFYEVADGTRAGMVFMTTGDQGAAHSFDTLNTGAVPVQRMVPIGGLNSENAHIRASSAAQYLNTATGAQGASFVVNNEHYFVNVGKYAVLYNGVGSSTKDGNMRMSYARAAGIFNLAGFDSAVGVQLFRGDDGGKSDSFGIPSAPINATEATIIDGQMQGLVGNMPLGIYVSYGTAPAITDVAGGVNLFNPGNVQTASSFNVSSQIGVVPGVATMMAAIRVGKSGAVNAVTGEALTDNALMVGGTYNISINVETSLSYTMQSGTAWDAANSSTGTEPPGKTVLTAMLQAMF